jgi:hypothetical protein
MNITIPDTTMRFQLSGDRALTLEGEDFEEFALGLWDKIGKHSISKTTRLDSREIRENLAAWLKMKTGTQLKESEAELIWIHACDALQRNLGTFGLDTVGTARLDNRVVLDQSTIALAETISAELDWIKEHRKLVNGRSYATNSEFAVLLAWDELRHRLPVYERLVWAMQHSSCAARPLVCREDGGHGPRILLSYDQNAVHRHAGTPMREHTAHYLLQEGQKLDFECKAFLCVAARSRGIVSVAEELSEAQLRQLRIPANEVQRTINVGIKSRRGGRPRKKEKDGDLKTLAALNIHHGYDNGVVGNLTPATNRDLVSLGASSAALTRFLKKKLPENPSASYRAACRSKRIASLLQFWNGEMPTRNATLGNEEPPEETSGNGHRRGRQPGSHNDR